MGSSPSESERVFRLELRPRGSARYLFRWSKRHCSYSVKPCEQLQPNAGKHSSRQSGTETKRISLCFSADFEPRRLISLSLVPPQTFSLSVDEKRITLMISAYSKKDPTEAGESRCNNTCNLPDRAFVCPAFRSQPTLPNFSPSSSSRYYPGIWRPGPQRESWPRGKRRSAEEGVSSVTSCGKRQVLQRATSSN